MRADELTLLEGDLVLKILLLRVLPGLLQLVVVVVDLNSPWNTS